MTQYQGLRIGKTIKAYKWAYIESYISSRYEWGLKVSGDVKSNGISRLTLNKLGKSAGFRAF